MEEGSDAADTDMDAQMDSSYFSENLQSNRNYFNINQNIFSIFCLHHVYKFFSALKFFFAIFSDYFFIVGSERSVEGSIKNSGAYQSPFSSLSNEDSVRYKRTFKFLHSFMLIILKLKRKSFCVFNILF